MLLLALRAFRIWLDWLVWSLELSGIDSRSAFFRNTPSIGVYGICEVPAGYAGC